MIRLQKHNGVILSFGWTWQELLAGKKTVTRRLWKERTANIFKKYYQEQKLVRASDKDLRYKGKVIAWIELTEEPYQELLCNMPESDVELEGGMVETKQEFIDKYFDGNETLKPWVIRFRLFELVD